MRATWWRPLATCRRVAVSACMYPYQMHLVGRCTSRQDAGAAGGHLHSPPWGRIRMAGCLATATDSENARDMRCGGGPEPCCWCCAAVLLADCPQYPGFTLRLDEQLICSAGGDPTWVNKGESHPAKAFVECQSRSTCRGFNAHITDGLACYHTAETFKTEYAAPLNRNGYKTCYGVYVKNTTAPTGERMSMHACTRWEWSKTWMHNVAITLLHGHGMNCVHTRSDSKFGCGG